MPFTIRWHSGPGLAGLVALLIAGSQALAQGWPAKTVRIIVPFAPGGTADTLGRLVSQRLSETRRPRVSAVPPGAKGTMMRTVLAGHPCARACEPAISRATSPASPGPECRASCERDAATGVILPEHRARIAQRPPRGSLCRI